MQENIDWNLKDRTAKIERTTKETSIVLSLNLDGWGKGNINTGIGFFDHMLESFAYHGLFDLDVSCQGDLHVDTHHTVEDVAMVLGQAVAVAVGDKEGIKRFGSTMLPMDETLISCALDLSGRPYFNDDFCIEAQNLGPMPTEMLRHFFFSFAFMARVTLHFVHHCGSNSHHIAEGAFKAFGHALDNATKYESRIKRILSTKGAL